MIVVLSKVDPNEVSNSYNHLSAVPMVLSGMGPVNVRLLTQLIQSDDPGIPAQTCEVFITDDNVRKPVIGTLCFEPVTPWAYRVVIRDEESL